MSEAEEAPPSSGGGETVDSESSGLEHQLDVKALASALSQRTSGAIKIDSLNYDEADVATRLLHWRAMCDQMRTRGATELVAFIEFTAGVPYETANTASNMTDGTINVSAWSLGEEATVAVKCEHYKEVPERWRQQDQIWFSAIRQAVTGGSWPDTFEEVPFKLASISLVQLYHKMTGGPMAAKRLTIKQLINICDAKAGADPATWSSLFKETVRNVNAHRITIADILDYALTEGISDFTLIKHDLDKKLAAQELTTRGKTEAEIKSASLRHNTLSTLLDISAQAEAAMESANGGSTAFTVTPQNSAAQAFNVDARGSDCTRCGGKHPSDKCFQTKHRITGKVITSPAPHSYDKWVAEKRATKRGDERSTKLQVFHARLASRVKGAKSSGFLAVTTSPSTMVANISDTSVPTLPTLVEKEIYLDNQTVTDSDINLADDSNADDVTEVATSSATTTVAITAVPSLDIDSNICLDNASAKGYDVTSLDALTTNADAALDDAIANFAEADAALDYAIAAQDAELDREYAEDTLCALHEETSTFSIEETTWITEHDQFYDQSTNDVVSGAIEDKYVHVSHRITTWGASVPGSAPRSSSIAAFTPSWMEDGDHASTASTAGSPTLTYETDHSDTGSLPSLVGSEVSESSYSSVESSASMTAPAIIEPGPSDDMSTPSLENIAADNHWPGAIEIENSDQIESDYTYAQQVYAYQIVENAVELEQIATDHVYATAILDDANVDSATTVW